MYRGLEGVGRMTFIDFFSGIGGFRIGLERAGHKCIGFCENDKYAVKSYNAMFDTKGEWYYGDIRTAEPSDLPEADIYCGGFPCQSFSVAGKRGGFEDIRGTLFFEVMRLVAIRKPKYLFLENVAGLLSHDAGNTFYTILNSIRECGYDVEYQVLNSKNFGVPQNRERVFIVGHFGGFSGRQVFPVIEESNPTSTIGKSTETAIANTFTAGGHSGGNHSGMTIIEVNPRKPDGTQTYQQDRVYDGNGLLPAICKDKADLLIKSAKIRRLTPLECWRLQGFPDEYFYKAKTVNSDSQLYKQAGNAVTCNVIYEIARRLI
jgi:DNA (cytosine-5)-methyltransferase 1